MPRRALEPTVLSRLFGPAALPRRPEAPAGTPTPAAPGPADLLVDADTLAALRRRPAGEPMAGPDGAPWAGRHVALLDPTGQATDPVLQLLASAGGQPVQQLQLRERGSRRALARLSRCTLRRPGQVPLQMLSTQGHGPAGMAQAFAEALAEQADLAVVFIGDLPTPALAVLHGRLLAATARPGWRCPCLLFILPVPRRGLQTELRHGPWPPSLVVDVLVDPPGQPLTLWNRIAERWPVRPAAVQPADSPVAGPAGGPPGRAAGTGTLANGGLATGGPGHVATPGTARPAANQGGAMARPALGDSSQHAGAAPMPPAAAEDADFAQAAHCRPLLARLAASEGVLACALVALDNGSVLAAEWGPGTPCKHPLDDLARALCDARRAHQTLSADPPLPDEVLITAGERQALLRRLPGPRRWGFLALADRGRVNLALLRFSLIALERRLGPP